MKEEKLRRFVSDKVMSEAVYDVLLASFLKKRPNADTTTLAAAFLSIGNLDDAWKELKKHQVKPEGERDTDTPHV